MNTRFHSMRAMQDENVDTGELQIQITSQATSCPISDAKVKISYTGDSEDTLEELSTDASGFTETIDLKAPPVDYSLVENNDLQPYSEYTLEISASGFQSLIISGTEILATVKAVQNVQLQPEPQAEASTYVIPAHTLYGDYPPKIAEPEIKPVNESSEIVLSRVVVPEYVVVHDGPPNDSRAQNYYVRYKDYIKNVASSEIYATWPANTIRANTLAIMSFTLNRIYTEWYRNQGYDFTITSSTAFDHKWIPERSFYDTISAVVDELFSNFLSRPNVRQPILTQYCDGRKVTCPNWMTQWGSKSLGDQNYSPIEIIRYFYGDNMYINVAREISGIPSSWPGYNLEVGSAGAKALQMQEQINTIAAAYPAISKVTADGVYGYETTAAVSGIQEVFGLPVTGVTDYRTWHKISEIYVSVSRIAELS